jgi:hypothetical protein
LKIKKTITEKVLAANRANARKSTGPRRTQKMNQNSRKHGLLSKKLIFESDEEKNEFEQLCRDLEMDRQPVGPIEKALVEEIGVCMWKVQMANGREAMEIENRRVASAALMQTLVASHQYERLPLFTQVDGRASGAHRGWECHELAVRCEKRNREEEFESDGDRKTNAGQVYLEAKLTTSLDSILHYQGALKRDLYRALAALRDLQRERKEGK